LVIPAQINFRQVTAHYAISSLFTSYPQQHRLYCYEAIQVDYQKQQIGSLTLAVGQVNLTSEITWESHDFVFAVLHLGGWDFHCCIQPFSGRKHYGELKESLFTTLKQASAARIVVEMSQIFGNQFFDLQHLFAQERHRIMQQVTEKTKLRLDQLYTQVYRDNYGILAAFQRDDLPVPKELQVAAEIAIAHRCLQTVKALEHSLEDNAQAMIHLGELEAISTEADYLRCQIQLPEAKTTLERLILATLWQVLQEHEPERVEQEVKKAVMMIEIGEKLHLDLSLTKAQEIYHTYLHQTLIPLCIQGVQDHNNQSSSPSSPWQLSHLECLLDLGETLAVDVKTWMG
jgi:alpha-amylase/alpha-mannosidase (GH57 family)